MYPEAGGSSSFARHAFNEVASFFAGWALTLDYIITISISAFFVPHYLGAFFPALRHNPGDIIGGVVVIALLAALNIRGLRESANLNIFLALADLVTQVGAGGAGRGAGLPPVGARQPGPPGRGAQLQGADLRALDLDGRLHGHRDRLEHGRGGARPRPGRSARPSTTCSSPCSGSSPASRSSRCRALPVTQRRDGHYSPRSARSTRTTRCWGSSRRCRSDTGSSWRSRTTSGVLAATILIIATNAGLIGISRLSWSLAEHRQLPGIFARVHPKLPHAVVHDRVLLGAGGAAPDPGEDRLPGQPLQLRRDAVVHHRARRDRRAALQGARPQAALPRALERAASAAAAAARRGARGDRHVRRLGLGGGAARARRAPSASAGWSIGMAATSSTAAAQGLDPRKAQYRIEHREAPEGLQRAGLRLRARADLRQRHQRPGAAARGQARRRGRDRRRALRDPGAAPAVARRGDGGGGAQAARVLDAARIRARERS